MVKSFPADSLNICGPTFFSFVFVRRRFGCLPTQSQHQPQPHPGRWCVDRLGYLLVCGRMGLALGLRRGSALVCLCVFISWACSCTLLGWGMGLPTVAFVAVKDFTVCLSFLRFLLFPSSANSPVILVQEVDEVQGSAHFQISLLGKIVQNQRGWNGALEPFLSPW